LVVLLAVPIRQFALEATSGQTAGMRSRAHTSDDQLDAATWCRHLIPQGSVYAFLADHRHELFPPALFADVARQGGGHPSVPAEVIATVLVLQALEGLSGGHQCAAARYRLEGGLRVAPGRRGVPPHRAGVLAQPPSHLAQATADLRGGPRVSGVVAATGVLRGRGRRVLDSTILEDAVATQDTVTQLVAAIRRVRRLVPQAREVRLTAHDDDRPGKPVCAWDDPQAKQVLVSGLVGDALAVLAAVGELQLEAEQAEAVALLALVAGQDVEAGDRPGSWRIARRVAPDRVISTVDPQARHTRKTSAHKRDGYKAHIAAEPETGLVTECALTAANIPDGPTGVGLLAAEDPGLEVLGDTGYGSGQTRAALRAAGHLQTIKPIPLQSAVPGGFAIHDFHIDQQAGTVRCPAGHTAPITMSGRVSFARHCQRCPLRQRCTTATDGRTIQVHPHEDELRAARRRATTRSFQQSYRRWRPMVERSIAWLVTDGCRRVPYRGIGRNDLWWSVRVAAVRGQLAPPAGAWPCPPRRRLGAGLRPLLPFDGVTMSWIVYQPTGHLPHRP
jgi:hypothetical protein